MVIKGLVNRRVLPIMNLQMFYFSSENYHGISSSTFCKYFENLQGNVSLGLTPVLEEKMFQKLQRMNVIRKVHFRIAALDNLQVFRNAGESVTSAIRLSRQFEAPYISVDLSLGRSRKGTLSGVVDLARDMLKLNSSNDALAPVEMLRITGKSEGGDSKLLDLLSHRMKESIELRTQNERRISTEDRQSALLTAWQARRSEIDRLYQQ